jgi:hypothetical protein
MYIFIQKLEVVIVDSFIGIIVEILVGVVIYAVFSGILICIFDRKRLAYLLKTVMKR